MEQPSREFGHAALVSLLTEAEKVHALQEFCHGCPEKNSCSQPHPSGECLARVGSREFHEKLKCLLDERGELGYLDDDSVDEFFNTDVVLKVLRFARE